MISLRSATSLLVAGVDLPGGREGEPQEGSAPPSAWLAARAFVPPRGTTGKNVAIFGNSSRRPARAARECQSCVVASEQGVRTSSRLVGTSVWSERRTYPSTSTPRPTAHDGGGSDLRFITTRWRHPMPDHSAGRL